MKKTSSPIAHFMRLAVTYLLVVAVLLFGIPATVIWWHNHGNFSDKTKATLPANINLSLTDTRWIADGANKTDDKLETLHFNSHLLTFGWLSGAADLSGTYNKLKVVSPACTAFSISAPVTFSLDPSRISAWHRAGLKVWGRIAIADQTTAATHQFLSNTALTDADIEKVQSYVHASGIDGLNIDIENISAADEQAFITFIGKLTQAVKSISPQFVLSIDGQCDSDLSTKQMASATRALANIADYIIFMGYDEHWSTDPVPGPVASLQWVDNGIQRLLQSGMPARKLLLGLPSYTRIWHIDGNGKTVDSRAVSNEYIQAVLQQENIPQRFQSQEGLYYSTFNYRDQPYEVWSSDTTGMQNFLKLVEKYHLGGFGFWTMNLLSTNQWNALAAAWTP
ncbi:MAG: glycosyl hydrolase family 18 protein [Sporolactobacillus sp.]